MNNSIKVYLIFFSLTIVFGSCSHSYKHQEEGKIFHAAPATGGIGALYFALYDDNTYQLCNNGGLAQNCYSGNFTLKKDTLTLIDLNEEVPLKSSKFLIKKYAEQDSSYWNWKYSKSKDVWTWHDFRSRDSAIGGTGDVYQLNNRNEIMKNESHFIIRLDGFKKYR